MATSNDTPVADWSRGYHFLGDGDNKVFLVRCYECGRENYSMSVASGSCSWCGSKEVPE